MISRDGFQEELRTDILKPVGEKMKVRLLSSHIQWDPSNSDILYFFMA